MCYRYLGLFMSCPSLDIANECLIKIDQFVTNANTCLYLSQKA